MKKMLDDRRIVYRMFLFHILFLAAVLLVVSAYYYIWCQVPSTIMVKAGSEQILDLKIPVSGKIYHEAVEASSTSMSSTRVNFGKPVTVKADHIDNYKMRVSLFGIIPLKEVNVEVINDLQLKPAGIPIGIYVKTAGVLVVGVGEFKGEDGQMHSPARYILQEGDYILEMNDEEMSGKKELIEKINCSEGQNLIFKVQRDNEIIYCMAKPELNESGEYKMGIWVRDNAQGVGTMTYIDEEGHFGALGHGINDVDTSELMSLKRGTLYHTRIVGITRGRHGSPGELTGFIEYDDRNIMGVITENSTRGIFGICSEDITENYENEYLPIGLKQEIEKAPAQILCSLGEEIRLYDIEITDINMENDNINRGIILKITDENLLSATGGIVQGMFTR